MTGYQRDWQSMLAALVFSLCFSASGFFPIKPIEKKPEAVPANAAPAYDPNYDENNYYPDCEDWEEVES